MIMILSIFYVLIGFALFFGYLFSGSVTTRTDAILTLCLPLFWVPILIYALFLVCRDRLVKAWNAPVLSEKATEE